MFLLLANGLWRLLIGRPGLLPSTIRCVAATSTLRVIRRTCIVLRRRSEGDAYLFQLQNFRDQAVKIIFKIIEAHPHVGFKGVREGVSVSQCSVHQLYITELFTGAFVRQ